MRAVVAQLLYLYSFQFKVVCSVPRLPQTERAFIAFCPLVRTTQREGNGNSRTLSMRYNTRLCRLVLIQT